MMVNYAWLKLLYQCLRNDDGSEWIATNQSWWTAWVCCREGSSQAVERVIYETGLPEEIEDETPFILVNGD